MASQKKKKERRKGEHLLRSKHTKQRGLPPTQQPRDVPPKVIKKSLPTVTRYKKISGLLVTEGRRKISNKTRRDFLSQGMNS